MNDSERIEHLIKISEKVHFVTGEALTAATIASVFGSQIPLGVTRYVWKMLCSPRSATAQQLQLTTGDAVTGYETVIIFRQDIPAGVIELGGNPLEPFIIIDPVLVLATLDFMVAVHETDAIDIDAQYFDLPDPISQ